PESSLFVWLPDGSSPARHRVEASVRPELMKITGNHIIIRNIIFRYASNVAQHAAVDLLGEHNLIENCVVEYTAGVGVHLGGRNNLARGLVSEFNGQMGMGVNGDDNQLQDCVLLHNNTLSYPRRWEAGGLKAVGTRNLRISRCAAIENNGYGLWFDIDNRNGVIENSYAEGNAESGIMVEISQGTMVRENIAVRNGFRAKKGWDNAGILIAESMNTIVEDNICTDNRSGIAVRQQRVRTLPANPELGIDKPISFYSYGLVLRDNIAAFNRKWQFALFADNAFFAGRYYWLVHRLLGKDGHSTSAGDMKLLDPSHWHWRLGHNVYYASSGSGLILWGAPWLPGHKTYSSLATFQRDQRLDEHSIVADPQFIDREHGNFSLSDTSPVLAVIGFEKAGQNRLPTTVEAFGRRSAVCEGVMGGC
ncbi:MAG: right-handed parallel beta-helix repeat-containing protein, partial [Candidatus Binataceae bacterium]